MLSCGLGAVGTAAGQGTVIPQYDSIIIIYIQCPLFQGHFFDICLLAELGPMRGGCREVALADHKEEFS